MFLLLAGGQSSRCFCRSFLWLDHAKWCGTDFRHALSFLCFLSGKLTNRGQTCRLAPHNPGLGIAASPCEKRLSRLGRCARLDRNLRLSFFFGRRMAGLPSQGLIFSSGQLASSEANPDRARDDRRHGPNIRLRQAFFGKPNGLGLRGPGGCSTADMAGFRGSLAKCPVSQAHEAAKRQPLNCFYIFPCGRGRISLASAR